MISHALHHLFLLLLISATAAAAATSSYNATDFILLNCGTTQKSNDGRRSWDGDERSKYAPQNSGNISSSSTASKQPSSVSQIPYETARIFRSNFTYTFPVSKGSKFIRLYFYPGTFAGFNPADSYFTLTANEFTLLSNFSAFLSSIPSDPSFMKEFVVNVEENQRLNLTFSPNKDSFAFINGIEIVSIPDGLYFRGEGVQIQSGNQVRYLKNDTALENLYRFNVGGSDVEILDDTGPNGMFRAWSQDDSYIFGADYGYTPHAETLKIQYTAQTPPYSAPEIVYTTSRTMGNTSRSLEWAFPVDSGFFYLHRFHFCEIQLEITKRNQRVFTISIDNQTLEIDADVIYWTGGTEIPIFRDYITWVPDDGKHGKKDLRLSLSPYTGPDLPEYDNALLNGLEIFKMSSEKNLAAANPNPLIDSSPPAVIVKPNKTRISRFVYALIGSVIGVVAVVAAVSFLIFRRRRRVKDSEATKSSWGPLSTTTQSTRVSGGSHSTLPSDRCRRFSLEEIKSATENFDENFIIGKGGFGNVYKGYIDGGATTVAIKRLTTTSSQGAHEFETEIEMLSKLRHLHLVSLIGYCDDKGEMILVYDYMSRGTLRSHLYNSENAPLSWKERLQICIGAAKGLQYLHTGVKHPIIHRDVKSTNILLDEKWVAKVSDFGLSKMGPTDGVHTHVSTAVKGSLGYVDPEYFRRRQLTDKSDVYSFGVVLFEVLCARPPIIPNSQRERVNLAQWARHCCKKGTIEKMVDPNLNGKIAPECLKNFVECAVRCLEDRSVDRPAMSDVLWSLEFAMQLQEAAAEKRGGDEAEEGGNKSSSFPLLLKGDMDTTDDEEMFSGSSGVVSRSKSSGLSTSNTENLKTGDVFSEIMNPSGR